MTDAEGEYNFTGNASSQSSTARTQAMLVAASTASASSSCVDPRRSSVDTSSSSSTTIASRSTLSSPTAKRDTYTNSNAASRRSSSNATLNRPNVSVDTRSRPSSGSSKRSSATAAANLLQMAAIASGTNVPTALALSNNSMPSNVSSLLQALTETRARTPADVIYPGVAAASRRVKQHLSAVHESLVAQQAGKAIGDEDLDEDAAVAAATAAAVALGARRRRHEQEKLERAKYAERLRKEDEETLIRDGVKPIPLLPGRQMMIQHAVSTNFEGEDKAAAALLRAQPKRSGEEKPGHTRPRKVVPSIGQLLNRQQWIRSVLLQRWNEVQHEIEQSEANDAQRAAILLAAARSSGPAPNTKPQHSRSNSILPSGNPQLSVSVSMSNALGGPSAPVTGVTSKRGSLVLPPGTSLLNPAGVARASSTVASRQASITGALNMDIASPLAVAPLAASVSPSTALVPVNVPAASTELVRIHGDDGEKMEEEKLDPDLDPIWDFGEGTPQFKAWYRSEVRKLNHTAYDEYVANYKASMEAEKDRLINGPKSIDQYALKGPGAPGGAVEPNPLHARAFAIRSEWHKKFPPVLQSSKDSGTGSESVVSPSNNARSLNPVLVPVIERKLMDLSKPLAQVLEEYERELAGLPITTVGEDDEDAPPSSSNAAHASSLFSLHPHDVSQGGAARPDSPRTTYNEAQSLTVTNLVSLLMQLDETALQAIRAEFETCSDMGNRNGLLIYDFVLMACTHIASSQASQADLQSLIEMFREIDINGDECMEWEEFTSHLVQLASTYGLDSNLDQVPHFVPTNLSSQEDTELHSRPCEIVKWFGGGLGGSAGAKQAAEAAARAAEAGTSGIAGQTSLAGLAVGLNKLILIERNSRLLKIYNSDLTCVHTIRCRASVLAVEFLPFRHQIVVSCSDRSLQFFSCKKSKIHWTLEFTWQLNTSQTCLEYAGKNIYTMDGSVGTGKKNKNASSMNAFNSPSKDGTGSSNKRLLRTGNTLSTLTPQQLKEEEEYGGSNTTPNFNLLYSGDTNGRITCWNLDRGEAKFQINAAHNDVVMEMKLLITMSNALLVSVGLDSVVKVWDCNKASVIHTLVGHQKAPLHVAFHPDLKVLITGGLDRYALVWPNPKTTAATIPLFRLPVASPQSHVIGIEILLGSPEVVIADSVGGFVVYDLRNGSVVQSFKAPRMHLSRSESSSTGSDRKNQGINSICVVPATGLLVAAGAKLFSFRRTTGVLGNRADDEPVQACVWDPHALIFITAASNNAKIWNGLTGALVREEKRFVRIGGAKSEKNLFITNAATITALCMDDRHRRGYFGLSNGVILNLNINTGAILSKINVGNSEISAIAYHSQTKQVIVGCWDGMIYWVDELLEHIVRKSRNDQTMDIISIQTAPEYKLIATLSADMTLCLYEDRQGPLIIKWQLKSHPTSMTFLSPYPFLLVGDQDGGISVFDIQAPFDKEMLFYIPSINVLPSTRPPSPEPSARKPQLTLAEIEEQRAKAAEEEEAKRRREKEAADLKAKGIEISKLPTSRVSSASSKRPGSAGLSARHFPQAVANIRAAEQAFSFDAPVVAKTTPKTEPQPAPMPDDHDVTNILSPYYQPPVKPALVPLVHKTPSITSMKFDPIHRWLLVTDDAGYVKVFPLAYALLRRFHLKELNHPSSPFYAKIFKAQASKEGTIIRGGFSLAVTAVLPKALETASPEEEKTPSVAEKLKSHATKSTPVGRRGSVVQLPTPRTPGGSVPHSTSSSTTALVPTSWPNAAATAVIAAAPEKPVVVYAPASLVYPPAPTRSQLDQTVIKSWSTADTQHALTYINPSLQIQAHSDAALGVDIILDTLYEPTLVSWSFDGGVRLWSGESGDRIGALMQGHNTRTNVREEKWNFFFDLQKHRAKEAAVYKQAFQRPPSPEVDEEELRLLQADEEEEKQEQKQSQPLLLKSRSSSTASLLSVPAAEAEQKPITPTAANTTAAVSTPANEGNDDISDDEDAAKDAAAADAEEITDIDAAFRHAKRQEARLSAKRGEGIHKKGDTFLTDLDGDGSHKKKKKLKKKDKNAIIPKPSSASDAARKLRKSQDKKEATLKQNDAAVTEGLQSPSAYAEPKKSALKSPAPAVSLRDPSFSASTTPITSPQPRVLATSQSQPVFSGVFATQTPLAGASTLTSPKAVSFHESSETPSSKISTPIPIVSPVRVSAFSKTTLPVPAPVNFPTRSPSWRNLPGTWNLSKGTLGASFVLPSANNTGNLSLMKREEEEKRTLASPLKQLTKDMRLVSLTPESASTAIVPASSEFQAMIKSPSDARPISPSRGPRRSLSPIHAARAPAIHVETTKLPSAKQFRGAPRLGKKKHMRLNTETGEEETDSDAEREEIEKEEAERRKRSWWTPDMAIRRWSTKPRSVLETGPKKSKKPTATHGEPVEESDSNEEEDDTVIRRLQTGAGSLRLNNRQAQSAARLDSKFKEADDLLKQDPESMNLARMERKHRQHAEEMDDYYFN